ncbi:hypothetical protein BRADI_4g28435v3 [Brachypodium distachyon]|uniref:Uncharacterized protein n=1 Tax=Brachypodium distachyon TaxID=15368 RepID=A0A0Q3HP95_BRADI|nr:hypothetical protein BRADI_4g28435v3 [Brachypodium distachyon]
MGRLRGRGTACTRCGGRRHGGRRNGREHHVSDVGRRWSFTAQHSKCAWRREGWRGICQGWEDMPCGCAATRKEQR